MNIVSIILETVKAYPALTPHLHGRARWIAFAFKAGDNVKTYEFFLAELLRMVKNVYGGNLGGEFIDILANLLSGQIRQAIELAWTEDGNELPLPDYLEELYQDVVTEQFDFVDRFYRDIVDARVDGTSIDPLLNRASMWANQYNIAYSKANKQIALESGGKLEWVYGDTIEHCEDCERLNGIVAYASDWEESGYQPGSHDLACGGWQCRCILEPTDKRKTKRQP